MVGAVGDKPSKKRSSWFVLASEVLPPLEVMAIAMSSLLRATERPGLRPRELGSRRGGGAPRDRSEARVLNALRNPDA